MRHGVGNPPGASPHCEKRKRKRAGPARRGASEGEVHGGPPRAKAQGGYLGAPLGGLEAGLLVPLLGIRGPGPDPGPDPPPCACPTCGAALRGPACPGPGPADPSGTGALPAPSEDPDAPPFPGGTALQAARAFLLLPTPAWPMPLPARGGRLGSRAPAASLGKAFPPSPGSAGGPVSSTRSGAGLGGRTRPCFLLFLGVTH